MLRSQRGLTLVELLVTIAIGAVVVIGAGAFYWRTTRAWSASNAQIAMQRQATLVQEELTRIVQASNGILGGTCGPSTVSGRSIPVPVPIGRLPETATAPADFCFYWAGSPGVPGGIVECRFNRAAANFPCAAAGRNLLLGDPTPQNVQATAAAFTVVGNAVVNAAFRIQAMDAATVLAGPLDFSSRVAVRN